MIGESAFSNLVGEKVVCGVYNKINSKYFASIFKIEADDEGSYICYD